MTQLATPVRLSGICLTAKVIHRDEGPDRCPIVSHITIMCGDLPLAYAVMGGKYSEKQALAAFQRERKKFKWVEDTRGRDLARELRLL